MDKFDLQATRDMSKYFVDLVVKCPSSVCEGFLDVYDEQGTGDSFKAFLMCSRCESRLRIHKKDKGWASAKAPLVI